MVSSSARILFRIGSRFKFQHARALATGGTKGTTKSTTTVVKGPDPAGVPGLSSAVLSVPSREVGPHASKQTEYKNPEYFCYNEFSYFEAEIEMAKYRIPQPSSVKAN